MAEEVNTTLVQSGTRETVNGPMSRSDSVVSSMQSPLEAAEQRLLHNREQRMQDEAIAHERIAEATKLELERQERALNQIREANDSICREKMRKIEEEQTILNEHDMMLERQRTELENKRVEFENRMKCCREDHEVACGKLQEEQQEFERQQLKRKEELKKASLKLMNKQKELDEASLKLTKEQKELEEASLKLKRNEELEEASLKLKKEQKELEEASLKLNKEQKELEEESLKLKKEEKELEEASLKLTKEQKKLDFQTQKSKKEHDEACLKLKKEQDESQAKQAKKADVLNEAYKKLQKDQQDHKRCTEELDSRMQLLVKREEKLGKDIKQLETIASKLEQGEENLKKYEYPLKEQNLYRQGDRNDMVSDAMGSPLPLPRPEPRLLSVHMYKSETTSSRPTSPCLAAPISKPPPKQDKPVKHLVLPYDYLDGAKNMNIVLTDINKIGSCAYQLVLKNLCDIEDDDIVVIPYTSEFTVDYKKPLQVKTHPTVIKMGWMTKQLEDGVWEHKWFVLEDYIPKRDEPLNTTNFKCTYNPWHITYHLVNAFKKKQAKQAVGEK